MLVLHGDPARFHGFSPEEMQKAIEKYFAWTKKPFMVESRRLGWDSGKIVRAGEGKPRVSDGPYSETKEVMGGFYTIEAADYDDAVQKSMDHPQLEYGGSIEIRQVWQA
jgi:hypothetical protein